MTGSQLSPSLVSCAAWQHDLHGQGGSEKTVHDFGFCLVADSQAAWAGVIFLTCLRTPCCGRSSGQATPRLSGAPRVAAAGWPVPQLTAGTRRLCSKWKKTLQGQHQEWSSPAVPGHERSKVSVQSARLRTAAWMGFCRLSPRWGLSKVEDVPALPQLWDQSAATAGCLQGLLRTASTLFPTVKEPPRAPLMYLPHQTCLCSSRALFSSN